MNRITCNIDCFKQYIQDSSAAIFSEESNKKHDWYRKMHCSVLIDDHTYGLSILPTAAEGHANCEHFTFIFDLELAASVTKTEAREMICRFADAVKFHPNINVTDNTDHGRAVVSERCFWLQPTEFKCSNYCWDEIPERADRWHAQIFMTVKQTPSPTAGTWGRSFDLNSDPVSLLLAAIRNRDEEIARKKAEEEARAEAERPAQEEALRKEKEEKKAKQEAHEKVVAFLQGIGDFVFENGTSIKESWREVGELVFLAAEPGSMEWAHNPSWSKEVRLEANNPSLFDENLQKIIKWAVENGAREPELKTEAA